MIVHMAEAEIVVGAADARAEAEGIADAAGAAAGGTVAAGATVVEGADRAGEDTRNLTADFRGCR